ncbi:hypothetical protein [Clostridium cellulovorans]|uniref:Uncharacterized protein n=1 Tax=Clostridium cellulovorans (strain ATCC 35296 / DSM 3052 / OCM 3 / 743B) TaxID=573061 RepID=D9SPK6_CLOC7|nr:hypothetical protein [Clostridium cellulovorans]ADL50055.1 hypothetical protein Clocel_0273 [Clostridium cellulovorans 743B]
MKKRLILLSALIIVIMSTALILSRPKGLTSKESLVKRVMEIQLTIGEVTDNEASELRKNIILTSEKLDPSCIPGLEALGITILSPSEIEQKTKEEGNFKFLVFNDITIDEKEAIITLNTIYTRQEDKKIVYKDFSGLTIRFHKYFGRWFEDPSREIYCI